MDIDPSTSVTEDQNATQGGVLADEKAQQFKARKAKNQAVYMQRKKAKEGMSLIDMTNCRTLGERSEDVGIFA
jgi:hypothetical protein